MSDIHTEAFANKLDNVYDEAVNVEALIAVYRQVSIADVDAGEWDCAMQILADKADSVSNVLSEMVGQARKGDAS